MACLSNAYFSPPEDTVWSGDQPRDWVKSETCLIFSPPREGGRLSFTEKLMASPLGDVRTDDNERDRLRGGGIGQQSPSTLWELMVAWPDWEITRIFYVFMDPYPPPPMSCASFSRKACLNLLICEPNCYGMLMSAEELGGWVREPLHVLGPAGVIADRGVSFFPSVGL